VAAGKVKTAFICILPIKNMKALAPISQLTLGGGMFLWLEPFLWLDTTTLSLVERASRVLR